MICVIGIPCMDESCNLVCPQDFAKQFLPVKSLHGNNTVSDLYEKYLFERSVAAHYQLRFCPGVDCTTIFFADSPKARRVRCKSCKSSCWCVRTIVITQK